MTAVEWSDGAPIYRQLKERVVAMLLDGVLKPGDALPSVRQVAAEYQLNPITVSRAYQELADDQLVEKRRGLGMYVTEGAPSRLKTSERDRFLREEWPLVLERIQRLGLDLLLHDDARHTGEAGGAEGDGVVDLGRGLRRDGGALGGDDVLDDLEQGLRTVGETGGGLVGGRGRGRRGGAGVSGGGEGLGSAKASTGPACMQTAPYDRVILGDLVLPDGILAGGYVAVRGETIAAIGQGAPPPAAARPRTLPSSL